MEHFHKTVLQVVQVKYLELYLLLEVKAANPKILAQMVEILDMVEQVEPVIQILEEMEQMVEAAEAVLMVFQLDIMEEMELLLQLLFIIMELHLVLVVEVEAADLERQLIQHQELVVIFMLEMADSQIFLVMQLLTMEAVEEEV
jgi:hypothetical protein